MILKLYVVVAINPIGMVLNIELNPKATLSSIVRILRLRSRWSLLTIKSFHLHPHVAIEVGWILHF